MDEEIREFQDPRTGFWVVLVDNSRTVYAYLLDTDQNVCGDVWICNLSEVSPIPEWQVEGMAPPFANITEFGDVFARFDIKSKDVCVKWDSDTTKHVRALLLLGERIIAQVRDGSSPGHCVNAQRDGPLALVLRELTVGKDERS